MRYLLSDKRILVTGANGGIGLSICETFLKNHSKLVLFYNKKRTDVDDLLKRHEDLRSSVEIHQIDLLDNLKLEHLMPKILESGKIDAFVHSVTLPVENKSVMDMRWEDYKSHIEIQTRSFVQIVQSLIPSMKERKFGKIISILTSYTVGRPPNKISNYIVGKYSLLGLTKSLAVELGPFGITVNSISPSITNTPLTEKLPSKFKEITINQIPLGRLAEPIDVAQTALFLCSKYSDYISGENFLVTGGQTMH